MIVQAMPYPAAGGSDPHFANVVLLTNFGEVDGGTSFSDDSNSAHTLTSVNFAPADTDITPFGSGASLLLSSGKYVTVADSDDWHFGTGDFTIEGWWYFNPRGTRTLISQYGSSGSRSWTVEYNSSTSRLTFNLSTTGSSMNFGVLNSPFDVVGSTWYHIVIERSGTDLRSYVDGVMLEKVTNSSDLFNAARILELGALLDGSQIFVGNIFDVRITKGVARYASDAGYTVPTEAFPRG